MRSVSADIDALWDFGEPNASEHRFRRAASGEHISEAMTQVARALGLQRKYDQAHATLDSIADSTGIAAARALLERGRLFNDIGDSERALDHFHRALAAAEASGADYYAVDAAHMIAVCATGADAIQANLTAIQMAAASNDERTRGWQGSLLNNLGWAHFEEGDYSAALPAFEAAVVARQKVGDAKRLLIAKWCVGRTLRALTRVDEALDIQYALLDGDGFAWEEVGECLNDQGNLEAARPYFAQAARLLEGQVQEERLSRLRELGRSSCFAKVGNSSVVFERSFDADTSAIWTMVGTKDCVSMWLGTIHGEIAQGEAFGLWINDDQSDLIDCKVEVFAPPNMLTMSWNDTSKISFAVAESALVLEHSGIAERAEYGAAWHAALDLIAHLLRGGPKETFVENYEFLRPEYTRLISRSSHQEIQ
ncbi:MAG: hypothetical protein M3R13_01050 [Armatimonadota bacterium]|nr:hypothetical protein [Armatimonadota bacterium]